MKVEIDNVEGITIIRPGQDIRASTIFSMRKVFETLEKENAEIIGVDLINVNFIDSSGVGLLLNFAKRRKNCNGKLCLFNYNYEIKELLDIIGIGSVIPYFDNFQAMKFGFDD